jgi:hypothetical protein
MKQVLKRVAIIFFGLVILSLLIWPVVLTNYAWYSAVAVTKSNPAMSVIPQEPIVITNNNVYEYTNLDTIRLPHVFENTKIEYQSSDVLAIIDMDTSARYLVFASEPMLEYFLSNDTIPTQDIGNICQKLQKIKGVDPCDNNLSYLDVLLYTSPDTIGFFVNKETKLYGSVLLKLKSVYVAADTTKINAYSASVTDGFIHYTPNGIAANVIDHEKNSYDIASYNMTPGEVESMIAAIEATPK